MSTGFYEKGRGPVNKSDPRVNVHNQGSVKLEGWVYNLGFTNSIYLIPK